MGPRRQPPPAQSGGSLSRAIGEHARGVSTPALSGTSPARQGAKVGKVSHLTNKEYMYVVSRECLAERLAPMQVAPTEQMVLFV